MKLLVFAHTPPPHHGQSYMVQLMLQGFGGDHRQRRHGFVPRQPAGDVHGIQCYHVNNRVSKRLEDIGEFHGMKLLLLLAHSLEAIWCRYRYGVTTFYYIPAPGKKSALYRDWLVMLLCRPFFKTMILHWHAAGLGKWLETALQIRSRVITYHTAGQADLSIVLSRYNLADAEKLLPRRVRVVSNGIPDPCPDFESLVLPRRRARFAARTQPAAQLPGGEGRAASAAEPTVVRVLYLAHCMREKGIFDALQGVVLANRLLAASHSPTRLKLWAAGAFVTNEEKAEFDRMVADPEMAAAVELRGFLASEEKKRAFVEADLFCFPTYYLGENQPVNIIEALAYGLPVVTTHWRSLPEMLPPGYPGLVPIRSPDKVAQALLSLMAQETGENLRRIYLENFTIDRHLKSLAEAISSVQEPHPILSHHAPAPAT